MATQTISTTASISTDAGFRAWGSAISAALAAVGLVQTSDTGQINWSTVTKATTTNTTQGYEIWHWADSLQSSKPVFMKISYGSGIISSGNSAAITDIDFGSGSDGSGNLTGITNSPANILSYPAGLASTAVNSGAFPTYVSHGEGSFTLITDYGAWKTGSATTTPWAGFAFTLARTVDAATGAASSDGVLGFCAIAVANSSVYWLGYGISYVNSTAYSSLRPTAALGDTGAASSGAVFYVAKNYAIMPTPYNWSGVLGYWNSEITAQTTFSAIPNGSLAHTYLTLGSQGSQGGAGAAESRGASALNAGSSFEDQFAAAVIFE